MKLMTKTPPNKIKTIENEETNSHVVFIFSTETTDQEFEDYIESLMQREFAYGEPMY